MSRLTPEQWGAIKTVWECDPIEPTYNAAARQASEKYQFVAPAKTTIESKAKKEGWERRGSMNGINVAAQRKADTISISDGKGVISDGKSDGKSDGSEIKLVQAARQDSENKRAEVIARHRHEWVQIAGLRQEALVLRQSDPVRCSERLKQTKMAAEITALQQAGERKAWGLDILIDPGSVKDMSDAELDAIIAGKATV